MLPEIRLMGDVDVAALSPLLRGMAMTVSYAETQGGIGLTTSGAMNRKFVHWAAVHFDWPGYTSEDLYRMNKVLNEADMPPLWVVRDMVRHLKLLRRRKDVLLPTKRGQDFLARPQACFDLIATDYLYGPPRADAGGCPQSDALVACLSQSYQYESRKRLFVGRTGERAIPE